MKNKVSRSFKFKSYLKLNFNSNYFKEIMKGYLINGAFIKKKIR